MSGISGNPGLPNEQTDQLAGYLGVLLPLVAGSPQLSEMAEQLHQLLLLAGWQPPVEDAES